MAHGSTWARVRFKETSEMSGASVHADWAGAPPIRGGGSGNRPLCEPPAPQTLITLAVGGVLGRSGA
jgi:hypothetical protein